MIMATLTTDRQHTTVVRGSATFDLPEVRHRTDAWRIGRYRARRSMFAMWLLALAMLAPALAAEALVPVPPLQARLTDLTGTLTVEQQAGLEQSLRTFETREGTQIAVLIVATTKPEEVEQYALRVVEQWKLGRKKVDDGALLLIAKDDRTLRIEVGYGIEGALNDAAAKRIVSEVIAPRLKEGDYFGGVSAGVDQIIRVVDGEPLPAPKPGAVGPGMNFGIQNIGQLLPMLFVLALVVGGVLRSVLGRIPGALATGGVLALAGWLLGGAVIAAVIGGGIAFLITLLGVGMGRHGAMLGGYYGGMGGGHRGGGGFGGGGFGGGGGGFGGGGASGKF